MSDALHVAVHGDPRDPAIVLLHGFLGDGREWGGVADAFPGWRVVRPDLPGHGKSVAARPAAPAWAGTVAALRAALDHHGVARPWLCGYSMGGRVALALARAAPEQVRGLILVSAHPGLSDDAARAARRAEDRATANRLREQGTEAFVRAWYRLPLFAPLARRPELLAPRIAPRMRQAPEGPAWALEHLGLGTQADHRDWLRETDLPRWGLCGELDTTYCGLYRALADEAGAGLRVACIPDAGHCLHVEQPAAFSRAVRAVLDAASA